jgi:hypothetical protein
MSVAVGYGFRLYRFLRAGTIARGIALSLCSLCALWITFLLRLTFSIMNIVPIQAFGVSVTDIGSMISAVFVVLSLRQTSVFWKVGRRAQASAMRSSIPVRTDYPLAKKLKN